MHCRRVSIFFDCFAGLRCASHRIAGESSPVVVGGASAASVSLALFLSASSPLQAIRHQHCRCEPSSRPVSRQMRDCYLVLRRRGTSPFIYLFRAAAESGPPKLLFPLSQVAGSPSKSPERISLITRTCESCIANLVINPTMSEEVLDKKAAVNRFSRSSAAGCRAT